MSDTVKLGLLDLKLTEKLSPRRAPLSTDHVDLLCDALTRGESLPPIRVCPKTYVVIDGMHRVIAYKKYHGASWETAEVPCIYDEEFPDPRTDALTATLYMARFNITHGLVLTLSQRRVLLKSAWDKHGETAIEMAERYLGMSQEMARRFIAPFRLAAESIQVERTTQPAERQKVSERHSDSRVGTPSDSSESRLLPARTHTADRTPRPHEFRRFVPSVQRALQTAIESVRTFGIHRKEEAELAEEAIRVLRRAVDEFGELTA